jgi:hypothetical protein
MEASFFLFPIVLSNPCIRSLKNFFLSKAISTLGDPDFVLSYNRPDDMSVTGFAQGNDIVGFELGSDRTTITVCLSTEKETGGYSPVPVPVPDPVSLSLPLLSHPPLSLPLPFPLPITYIISFLLCQSTIFPGAFIQGTHYTVEHSLYFHSSGYFSKNSFTRIASTLL